MFTTEQLITSAVQAFACQRGQRTVFAGGRRITVHTPNERVLLLPNGTKVRVSVDDSGRATQIEENDSLHAIARPAAIRRTAAFPLGVPYVSNP